MNKYRVYAKIIGPILPKASTNYDDCVISPMSLSEQEQREFKPIETDSPDRLDDEYYSSYVTHRRVVDPRIIKSGYVIFTDVEASRPTEALGKAILRFEKNTGAFSIASAVNYSSKHRVKSRYTNYEYQLVKIYHFVDGKESEITEPISVGGMVSHIKLPSETNISDSDSALLERILKSKDEIFWKALGYLQSGAKGFHNNTPSDKMTLDFMKSIELIINLWNGRSFSTRLKRCSKEINIDEVDQREIKKLWALRSNGDVAHARQGRRDMYPQFPMPTSIDGPYIDSSSLAGRVLTNYFLFRDAILSIHISDKKHYGEDELIDVNHGSAFTIRPSRKDKKFLTPFLKKKISQYFDVPLKKIHLYAYQSPYVHFKILDHLKFNIHKNKIPNKMIIVFGSL